MNTPTYAMPAWDLGLDLGQRHDHSALVTLETMWTHIGRHAVSFEQVFRPTLNVCGIRRYPLGTPFARYPGIVARRLAEVRRSAGGYANIHLIVDAGGPGMPVVEDLRRAHLGVNIRPVFITSGNAPGRANGVLTVPRRDLIANVILLLDKEVLRWPERLNGRRQLEHELLELSAGNTHPDHASAHDDLVMALALAAWQATQRNARLLDDPDQRPPQRWSPIERLMW